MQLTILQESPDNFFDLLMSDPFHVILVIILWGFAFMYGWWAITGRENIPRMIFVLTMILIAILSLMVTFIVFPDMYDLASENPLHFAGAFIGSAAFGIIILPLFLTMGLGAFMGFLRSR